MVKALLQDPMHTPLIYKHGFQAALHFTACHFTTLSRKIRFRSCVSSHFYHSSDRQGMHYYLHFIITKSSLFLFPFMMSLKYQATSHSTGSTFWERSFSNTKAPPSASFASFLTHSRQEGRGREATGSVGPWGAYRIISVLFSVRVPALPRSVAPAPFQRAPSRCHGNARRGKHARTPSLARSKGRRASHSGFLSPLPAPLWRSPPSLLPFLPCRDSFKRRPFLQAARALRTPCTCTRTPPAGVGSCCTTSCPTRCW